MKIASFRNYKFDWYLLIVILVLSAIGLAAIYSVDLSRGGKLMLFSTQLVALGIGWMFFFIASFLHPAFYRASARLAYLLAVLLLVGVLFFGETIRGTTGWFKFGNFSFQPAEFAKLALILLLAWWIGAQGRYFERPGFIISTGIFTFILISLILLQPDFGSAVILGGIWFGFLLLTKTKKSHLAILISLLAALFLLGWFFFFADYQKERFLTFFQPSRDPLRAGYNVNQSIIAVGSGQIFGRGLGFGSQSQLHFLPEAQTDFIFAVIAEELGLVGALIVLVLYSLLIWRLLSLAGSVRDDFTAFVVLGILLFFSLQVLVNIGGTLGLLPLTGVTLPFLSYGGSSLVINFLFLGIAESIYRTSRQSKEAES